MDALTTRYIYTFIHTHTHTHTNTYTHTHTHKFNPFSEMTLWIGNRSGFVYTHTHTYKDQTHT